MNTSTSTSQFPPPAYSNYDERNVVKYHLYSAHQNASTTYHNGVTSFYLFDTHQRRFTYMAKVPKKREGWKADILLLSEKGRQEARYEVRREPLARKFDFRPPNGMHNVMTPSVSPLSNGHRSFAIEAPDGQKLVWRKQGSRCTLISLPSNATIVQYDSHSHHNHTNPSQNHTLPHSSSASHNVFDSPDSNARPAMCLMAEEQEVFYHGTLSFSPLPELEVKSTSVQTRTQPIQRSQSHSSITSSHSSSTQSDHGPRLYGAHKKGSCVGLWGPAVIGAAFGSPWIAAGMNRHCLIGDELRNLGRATINSSSKDQRMEEYESEIGSSSYEQAAEHWASLNRFEASAKNTDPRPRRVEMDLVLASMIAVLTG